MNLRDLRDLPDADLLDRLPYCGREGVLIGAELARRLADLRAEWTAEHVDHQKTKQLLNRWRDFILAAGVQP